MKSVRVLYVDLDGTVRKGFDEIGKFVNNWQDVELFDGVKEILQNYKKQGWRIVGITNQGGVALGLLSMQDLQENIAQTQKLSGLSFDKILACTHHPEAKEKEFAVCWCRKPSIGNIVLGASALNEMYPNEYYPPHIALFVGDRQEDEQCAKNANIEFQIAKEWRENPKYI